MRISFPSVVKRELKKKKLQSTVSMLCRWCELFSELATKSEMDGTFGNLPMIFVENNDDKSFCY